MINANMVEALMLDIGGGCIAPRAREVGQAKSVGQDEGRETPNL